MGHPERIIPDETEPGIVALHLKRYAFARDWCEGRDVLDVGCGAGYGTAYLAESARRVVGGDIDADAVGYARGRYAAPNVEFAVFDAAILPFENAAFDTVCAFEVIEHVDDPATVLREIARVLRPAGTFLLSTPRADVTTHAPENPYHRVEFSADDFARLLRERFGGVELYGQRRLETKRHRLARRLDVLGLRRRSALLRRASVVTGTPAMDAATLDDVEISRDGVRNATELFAVCTARLT
jgi:SAM-dependent methyltransferase